MDGLFPRRWNLRCRLIACFALAAGLACSDVATAQFRQNGFNQPGSSPALMPVQGGVQSSIPSTGGWSSSPDARIASTSTTVTATPVAGENADGLAGKIPTRNLLQIFTDGGILMYPIAICSFAMMVFFFERMIALRPVALFLGRS